MQISHPSFSRFLYRYKTLIQRITTDNFHHAENNVMFWQNKLFTIAVGYALPISVLVVIFCITLELKSGNHTNVILDVIALLLFIGISVNQHINLQLRKGLLSLIIIIFAITMMITTGALITGIVYLFSLSIFISLQFTDKLSYGSVAINALICFLFSLLIYFHPYPLPLFYQSITLDHWVIYSLNFLFMNLIAVVLIRKLLNGLDKTLAKESFLSNELQKEISDRNFRNDLLKESEAHYKALFFQSPLPKWIIDVETLKFLQVNNATINAYGYSEAEFLEMSLSDIHPSEIIEESIDAYKTGLTDQADESFITRHITKSGEEIDVEFRRSNMQFKGKEVRLVIATDITQQIKHNRAIEIKNKKLKEIAYMQSHVIRVPLANILGLSELLLQTNRTEDQQQLFEFLDTSIKQLDNVINEIVRHAEDNNSELL